MVDRKIRIPFFAASVILAVGCSSDSGLRPFTSDGCSLFPDSSLINTNDWCSCCFTHDIAYWRGGTAEERDAADLELKNCVFDKTQNEVLASLMYEGVHAGGSPYFYNWYRWGYGWGYERKYRALTSTEGALADGLLQDYFSNSPTAVCQDTSD
jgi:hypothetical protein